MLIKTSELTKGMKLRVERRRRKQTQQQAAKRHKVHVSIYRAWEKDDDAEKKAPSVPLGKLQVHEQCWIRRQLKHFTIEDLSRKMKKCRWWIIQMERGDAPVQSLKDYWSKVA